MTTTSPVSTKRNVQGAGTAKILVMVVSLAIMLGGWGALAADQAQRASHAPSTTQPAVDSQHDASVSTLRQVTVPSGQSGPIARTRSSR